MPYCTLTDIITRISEETALQLCDDAGVGAFVASPANAAYSNLVAAIADADALIDSKLGGRYEVPVTTVPVPPLLKACSANLAICHMFDRRREMDIPEGVKRRRDATMKLLNEVRDGTAVIPELSSVSGALYGCTRGADDRDFSDELLSAL